MAEISAQVDLSTPNPPRRRETAAEKARRLRQGRGEHDKDDNPTPQPKGKDGHPEESKVVVFPRLTARVHPAQLTYLRDNVKEYRAKSVGPKLTNDELTRIALNLLQKAVESEGDIVTFVNKYRAGELG